MTGEAGAFPNVALIKYWGKRDAALNLPTTDSLSITLDRLATVTKVRFMRTLSRDVVTINGWPEPPHSAGRVGAFLDLVRVMAETSLRARVESVSEVPMGIGFASSAAGFAALALAATRALDLSLDPASLSRLARRGSGSACRSLMEGFVKWRAGTRPDGLDSVAETLYAATYWPLALLMVSADPDSKAISSRTAMERTVRTSPLYREFLEAAAGDLAAVETALRERRWELLGPAVERHALLMHATALGATPPIRYWRSGTIRVMDAVQVLREEGFTVYFTLDAGPNPIVLCPTDQAGAIASRLASLPDVRDVQACRPGPGAW